MDNKNPAHSNDSNSKRLFLTKEKSVPDLDSELNKIFHPQRFDHRQLSSADEGTVDEGARFFYSNSLHSTTHELDTISEDELHVPHARPFYGRSISLQERPIEDRRLQKSATHVTFAFDVPEIQNAHSREFYPQNHPIMTKIQRKTLMKRASTDLSLSNKVSTDLIPKRKKAVLRPTDSFTAKLPTIYDGKDLKEEAEGKEDMEKGPEEDSALNKERSSSPAYLITDIDDEGPIMDEKPAKVSIADIVLGKAAGSSALLTSDSDDRRVSFSVGQEEEEVSGSNWEKGVKKSKKRKKRRSHVESDLSLRRRQGSELHMEEKLHVSDEDLNVRDACEIASHRGEHFHGLSRHKIYLNKSSKHGVSRVNRRQMEEVMDSDNQLVKKIYGVKKEFDHSPHTMFVEMDQLQEEQWIEMARWIKYEEDREEGAERWGKPHVSSLSFHSLINLRFCLESSVLMLDLEATDLPDVMYRAVEEFGVSGAIANEYQKRNVLQKLLYRHKYVTDKHLFKFGSKRIASHSSLSKILTDETKNSSSNNNKLPVSQSEQVLTGSTDFLMIDGFDDSSDERKAQHERDGILKRIKIGTEGTIVLVGSIDDIFVPLCALIRLAEAVIMPNVLEVSIPIRFIFILLTPKSNVTMDCYEIGRCFSTLMSYPKFHTIAYQLEERKVLLSSINEFLDESVVLPPGDWDSKNLLSLQEIQNIRHKKKLRQEKFLEKDVKDFKIAEKVPKDEESKRKKYNPLERSPYIFGGLYNDIKKRYPFYVRDIIDGFKIQCLSATIFIYFAALSGAIAFGGLIGDLTLDYIGISETLIVTSVSGSIFALLAGSPLLILGVTGPVLLYDEALFKFTVNSKLEFLPWRVWIGIWVAIISLVVAALQGSVLVKYFTKFTKEIFAALVSLLFIYEAIRKVVSVFVEHPLVSVETYCNVGNSDSVPSNSSVDENRQARAFGEDDLLIAPLVEPLRIEPNTSLLSLILMLGTFLIAYFLRIFRNSKFLGRTIRRALGDFGVPIAIVIMVSVDYTISDTYTTKLNVPAGVQVTDSTKRNWLISPLGLDETIPIWACFAAILPAILLYLLLFMETHICELIMMEKSNEKGSGLHLDIVLLSLLNCGGAFVGGPWICAATVRSVSHLSALTVMSTTHAPGESPKIVNVIDQRITALMVSILIGLSVLLSPMLKIVPYAVIFGVFLYMGVSSINGIQFFDRLALIFLPVKHHPQVSYVQKVKTWKMHLFTAIEASGLAILWIVKSTKASLAFPFFVVGMVPYRWFLKFLFTERELDALDGPKAGQAMSEDHEEPDFYEQGH